MGRLTLTQDYGATDRLGDKPVADTELIEKVAVYVSLLQARDRTWKHVRDTERRILQVLELIKATRLNDLRPSAVQIAIKSIGLQRGFGPETLNRTLTAIKAFSRFLWVEGYVATHQLVSLKPYNIRLDRRHDRRALSIDELGRLYASAAAGPKIGPMTGADRALMYEVIANTGLRLSEIASLRKCDFDLAANPATASVRPGYAKNRRASTVIIRPYLIDRIRARLAVLKDEDRLFRLPAKPCLAIRRDVEAAGLEYQDSRGLFADHHALRHTFITNLGRAGVSLKTVQELARHQTPAMTIRYMHSEEWEKRQAIDALPYVETFGSCVVAGTH